MSTIFNSPMLTLLQSGPKTPEQQVQRATSPLQQSLNGRQKVSLPDFTSQPLQIKPIIPARDATGTAQSVQHNTHTDQVPTNIDERLKRNRQILGDVVETAIDFTPIVGDIKGLTWDPIKAGIEGGFGAGLSMAGLGLLTLIPGADFLRTIPLNKIDEFKSLAKNMEIDLSRMSDKKIQKALNDRIERLQTEVKKDKSDRITVFGDKSINQGLTYKNNELVGFVQVDPRYNGLEREGFKIGRIDNLTIDPATKKSRIKDHTVYGLDAALKYSKAYRQKLYSGDLLLTPEATLKQEEKFNYLNTDKAGKLFVTNNDEYAARFEEDSNISEILNRIKKWHNDHIDVFEGETELSAFSLPKYFNHVPITRNGQVTYLINPANKDLLNYISDTPGWYVREILGLKNPSMISHSVYSVFPHPQSFYEKVVNPDDLPSFQDFGILEYKQGGKINEDNTNRN